MAGKRTKPKLPDPLPPPPPRASSTVRPLFRIAARGLFAVGLIVLVLVAVVKLGGLAALNLSTEPRYQIPFTEIQCDAPPGIDRLTFLTEVRFLSEAKETISIADPTLANELRQLFSKHPWTSEVTNVTITPTGEVQVQLVFRTPLLAVTNDEDEDARAVDRYGVLLPTTAPTADLTKLLNPRPKPTVTPGTVWPDDHVKRAADLAQTYKPLTIEKTDRGWQLVRTQGKPLIVGW